MAFLFGEFNISIDAKGRFLIPAGYRKQLTKEETLTFMVNRNQEGSLNFYTKAQWEIYAARVIAKNTFTDDQRMLKRLYFNGATWVEPDSAERVLMPKNLLEYAQFEKDITLVCMGDYSEIWPTDKYIKMMNDNQKNYNDLSNKVMGENNNAG